MKIVILDGYTENPGDLSWDAFRELGQLQVYDRTAPEEVVARIGDAEIVIINKTPMTEQVMSQCDNLRYIGVLATGYNVVEVQAAQRRGIAVTNIPTYGTTAVAQYTMALLLEVCHHVAHHSQAVFDGRWENCVDWCFWDYPLIELAGKTMGIIGFGRIGHATAQMAKAFGMEILAYDVHQTPTDLARYASMEEVLSTADVLVLHCPLFPETEGLVNRNTIDRMKDGVIIINDSRGGLIVEQDLADALNSGKVYAAAVDVVSTEPIRSDNPLLKAKNCLITPHIAWAPKESRQRLMDIAVSNLAEFLNGNPKNRVN